MAETVLFSSFDHPDVAHPDVAHPDVAHLAREAIGPMGHQGLALEVSLFSHRHCRL